MTTVAYLASRFPKITETFVLYEMKALEEVGARVEVFALQHEPPGPRHPEAIPYERRAHFAPLLSRDLVRANLSFLRRKPGLYLRTWWEALSETWGSPKFMLGALAWFPKCVAFAERMRALGVDHVHAHFAHHPALAAFVVNRLSDIPYSFTAHGSDLHVDRTMLRAKVDGASFVVAVSAYNRDLIVEECGERYADKIRVIHCGADPTVFGATGLADEPPTGPPPEAASRSRATATVNGSGPSAPVTAAGNGAAPFRIACVASLEPVKGHRYLLDACRLLADRGIDFRCDLAGDGSLRRRVESRVAKLGLQDRVAIHGAVPRPDVRRILSGADVAVLASIPTPSGRREGIPVALMEAMMSELPVVASGVSGIPELVRDGQTGFLVPPGDPWSLADRLERLARDPALRTRFGAAGRRVVATDFDLETGSRLLHRAIVSS